MRSTVTAGVAVLLATGWAHGGPLTTAKGTPIAHVHKIGPTKPPYEFTSDMQPGDAAYNTYKDFWDEKLDGLQKFEDPIAVLGEFTRSYDCHSWTFRNADTQLSDLSQRYHILGESVLTILQDEGYKNITDTPASWKVNDVVVFYKQAGGTPVHTGRLSSIGTSFDDPNLRFKSKWAWTHPLVEVSLRDAMKLYGSVVEIWTQRAYHVVLDWDKVGTDLDLHFRPPDGASFVGDAYPNDCAYYNRTPDWGVQGDPSDDPSLDKDCITDCTEENISVDKLTTPGPCRCLVS